MLFTFGYEGLDLDRFTARLLEAGIGSVVDVRQLPLSHKRGFSKRALAAALATAGVGYVHMPALGCPPALRRRYKADGDWEAFSRGFLGGLARQGAALGELIALARSTAVCLVCFEADFNRCHRTLVARATGLPVTNLETSTARA